MLLCLKNEKIGLTLKSLSEGEGLFNGTFLHSALGDSENA